ncbi:MAG: excalibur domain-containing protein [Devosia nanyangense]|uniref:Excalibur domain-containing protein n=1 Tax=Devosia nanyangense TaxID=1228055 RepID=A0A933L1I0_9HYPH|nr:excalibur domain-containing protein [Devosia nanyangense]
MKRIGPIAAVLVSLVLAPSPMGALAESRPAGGSDQADGSPLGPQCHPNYALVCVPIASDVDCADGNGNGPAYVRGPVEVIGEDVYELDRDGDGIACEPKQ